jgi:YebC/PmpR family DNA-binding regulatory protein
MSGHSKWHQIKHAKGITDLKRGKVFARHAHNITMAAKQGGADLSMNPALRLAIDTAKKDNVPNDNIERAIKKGTGELQGGVEMEEALYEGKGPGGLLLILEALTDNRNRTATNLRTIFSKNEGELLKTGSLTWMFDRISENGKISYKPKSKITLEDSDAKEKALALLNQLNEDQDVSRLFTNSDLNPEEEEAA